jgi:ribonuclease HI
MTIQNLSQITSSHVAFLDGACSGNPGPGGWGAVLLTVSIRKVLEWGGRAEKTTNNIMELTGLLELLKYFDQPEAPQKFTLSVFMDSQYVLNGAGQWRLNWKKKGWKKADNSPVMNLEIWKQIDELLEKFSSRQCQFKWVHVKAHDGNPANERVDQIAVQYSKNIPVNLYNGPLEKLPYDFLASLHFKT